MFHKIMLQNIAYSFLFPPAQPGTSNYIFSNKFGLLVHEHYGPENTIHKHKA